MDFTQEATIFSYSHEEGQRIITTTSLLDEMTATENPGKDFNKAYSDLQHLMEKDTKLYLNSITLPDYWRKGQIPRGLRIMKFPANGAQGKTAFRDKWEAILNKCSIDTIESTLSGYITAWYGNCSAHNRKALQRVVRSAQRITGGKLPALQDTYTTRCYSIVGTRSTSISLHSH